MKASLRARMGRLGFSEKDLVERFVLGSGKGGQKINKTASCVYIKHLPTGLEVKCQKGRSREYNRHYALSLLCDKIEEKKRREHLAIKAEKERKRRQQQRRSPLSKEKMLMSKKERSQKKQLRAPLRYDED